MLDALETRPSPALMPALLPAFVPEALRGRAQAQSWVSRALGTLQPSKRNGAEEAAKQEAFAWLPEPSIYRTWVVVREWDSSGNAGGARCGDKRTRRARRAERVAEYQAAMAAEPALTRAALARPVGVSRAWITCVLGKQTPRCSS